MSDISKIQIENSQYNIKDRVTNIDITQSEYDALPFSKLSDDKNYFITDDTPPERTVIYGIHIDPSESDPEDAVTYLNDAVTMSPVSMGSSTFNWGSWHDAFFMPKPCMLKYDGTVDYYLDPSDYSKKADGTASDIANSDYDGNAMMEFPKIYWKWVSGVGTGEGYFYCSNIKVDDTYNCWCNYDADGNEIDHFYIAIYNGTGTTKLRSLSGLALTPANGNGGTTGAQEVERATANNTGSKVEWYINTFSDTILIYGLLLLIGKSLDLQSTFGKGLDSGSQSAKESYVTGTLNTKGLFWGSISSGAYGVKVFGIENFWGCCWHRVAGLIGISTGSKYAYKLTWSQVDGSSVTGYSSSATGYLTSDIARPDSGYVSKMAFGKYGALPQSVTNGTSSTYYCDYYYNGTSYALFGGRAYLGLGCGYYWSLYSAFSFSNWGVAAALSCKPLA